MLNRRINRAGFVVLAGDALARYRGERCRVWAAVTNLWAWLRADFVYVLEAEAGEGAAPVWNARMAAISSFFKTQSAVKPVQRLDCLADEQRLAAALEAGSTAVVAFLPQRHVRSLPLGLHRLLSGPTPSAHAATLLQLKFEALARGNLLREVEYFLVSDEQRKERLGFADRRTGEVLLLARRGEGDDRELLGMRVTAWRLRRGLLGPLAQLRDSVLGVARERVSAVEDREELAELLRVRLMLGETRLTVLCTDEQARAEEVAAQMADIRNGSQELVIVSDPELFDRAFPDGSGHDLRVCDVGHLAHALTREGVPPGVGSGYLADLLMRRKTRCVGGGHQHILKRRLAPDPEQPGRESV